MLRGSRVLGWVRPEACLEHPGLVDSGPLRSTDVGRLCDLMSAARRNSKSGARVRRTKVRPAKASAWTFLSNHAHVLLLLARDKRIRLRDVATAVGITERAVQGIVKDLEAGRYLRRIREGRCNIYTVNRNLPLRHPIEAHRKIASLIALVVEA